MNLYQLAQINIAKAQAPMDSDIMSGFVNRIDEINALAENSPGFVWRQQTEDGDATSIQAYDDPNIIVNMSVWEDIESLKSFVYKSMHVDLIRDRDAWFDKMVTVHQTLWWIPSNTLPTVEEGISKLVMLEKNGPTPNAFTFAKNFPATALT
jgi:hypothetical protein